MPLKQMIQNLADETEAHEMTDEELDEHFRQLVDGFIDQAMFIQSLQALLSVQDEVNISDESLEHLSQTLVNEKGTIDYTLFVDSFSMNAR